MKILNRKMLFAAVLLAAVAASAETLRAQEPRNNKASCSPFNAVYTPYPAYGRRGDGIHYTVTIEDQECAAKPSVEAKVNLDTLDKTETLLSRLTMLYHCSGTGWICQASLSKKTDEGKPSDHIVFDTVALSSEFNRVDFLGEKGRAPHALIFPGIDHRFRYLHDWDKFQGIQFFTNNKATAALNFEFVPRSLGAFAVQVRQEPLTFIRTAGG